MLGVMMAMAKYTITAMPSVKMAASTQSTRTSTGSASKVFSHATLHAREHAVGFAPIMTALHFGGPQGVLTLTP